MAQTVQNILDSARYDLEDYETGIVWDDVELLNYLNRMVGLLDSSLTMVRSDLVFGYETDIDFIESQDYVDISDLNSGNWDTVRAVWNGTTKLTQLDIDEMYYKRKWYSDDTQPYFWCLSGTNILLESGSSEGYNETVVPTNATNLFTSASAITYDGAAAATADGPYWLSAATTMPTGLSAETDYYLIVSTTKIVQVATTAALATAGTAVAFSDDGTGAITIQESTDLAIHYNKRTATLAVTDNMPYSDIFNESIREMLVMHAQAKKDGQPGTAANMYVQYFKERAWQETIRRGFAPRPYNIDF